MKKQDFYLQGTEYDREMFHCDARLRFEWNIIYSCNFRCPYCFFEGKWENYGKRNVILPPDKWHDLWKEIYEKYDRCAIIVTGGEPFVYPDFIKIIRHVSEFHYPINISTNASMDLNTVVGEIDPKRISLSLSFHPEYNSLQEIIDKSKYLVQNGFRRESINMVAYPPYLSNLNEYVEQTINNNESLKVIPFIGKYNGKEYPGAYTEVEKELLGMNEKWEKNVKREGTLCAAGMKSVLIYPDGQVARCGQIGERVPLGNFIKREFKLLEGPLPCDVELCPCLETISVEE
ncbi:radical SAM protein [Elusimicrobiota bacterium]